MTLVTKPLRTHDFPKVLVFDVVLRRPASPILQAVMFGDPGIARQFPRETWLATWTADMGAYKIESEEQLQLLIVDAFEATAVAESAEEDGELELLAQALAGNAVTVSEAAGFIEDMLAHRKRRTLKKKKKDKP